MEWLWIVGLGALMGGAIGWFVPDLARGKNPRWLETTRYSLAKILKRERQYWHGYDIAKYGYDRLERINERRSAR